MGSHFADPVSYTHLDVYKRQGIMRTANHTEIELFIFLFRIGVIKIIKKRLEKTALCLKRV